MLHELHAAAVTLHGVGHVTDVRGEVEGVKTPVRYHKILIFSTHITPGIMVGVAVKTSDLFPG